MAAFTLDGGRSDGVVRRVGFVGSGWLGDSYAWDFGDGGSATGATPDHTYAAAGTYQVKLTVTDNKGATNSTTQQVTVTAPVDPAYATDAFNRTVANGWGDANLGGAWTVPGALPKWSVNGTAGGVSLAAGGSGTATLSSVSKTDTEVAATLSTDKAATGGGQYLSVIARQVGPTTDYRGKVQFRAGGTVAVVLSKMVSGTETAVSSTVVLPGVTIGAGERPRSGCRRSVPGRRPCGSRHGRGRPSPRHGRST